MTKFIKLVFNNETDKEDTICDLPSGSYIDINETTLLMIEKAYNELHNVFYDTVQFKEELSLNIFKE